MSQETDTGRIIAKNIAELRKSHGMTQAGLAEQLGYSDKSVSKWERGEGLPDLLCMKRIADLFEVTVDWFFEAEHADPENAAEGEAADESTTAPAPGYVTSRTAVALLSIAGVWMLAAVVYVILKLCDTSTAMPFVIALPVTALLCVIFHALWGSRSHFRRGMFASVTALIWTILFMICWFCRAHDLWLLMILGFPGTVVAALSCRVRKRADGVQ